MASLTNAQKAPLLIDGDQWNASTPGVNSTDPSVASVTSGPDGKFYVYGINPGSATIVVNFDGRSGSLQVDVSAEPYEVTLGTPEPK